MTDLSYQASGEGQICLDLHLFVPSLVLHGSSYPSLLSDPSELISMTEKPRLLDKIGQSAIMTRTFHRVLLQLKHSSAFRYLQIVCYQ
jgi:hypothetical protein